MNEPFPSLLSPHISYPAGETSLPESLIRAYLATEYRVSGAGQMEGFTLEVGRKQPALVGLMRRRGADSAAFITAWNPFGEQLSPTENAYRNQRLREELTRRSLGFIEGAGEGVDGDWPREESYLVIGLDLSAAKRLGDTFEQNALVWTGADGVPKLVLLR
jgi:hypothetical protein